MKNKAIFMKNDLKSCLTFTSENKRSHISSPGQFSKVFMDRNEFRSSECRNVPVEKIRGNILFTVKKVDNYVTTLKHK
jgi:hypothetical protein